MFNTHLKARILVSPDIIAKTMEQFVCKYNSILPHKVIVISQKFRGYLSPTWPKFAYGNVWNRHVETTYDNVDCCNFQQSDKAGSFSISTNSLAR